MAESDGNEHREEESTEQDVKIIDRRLFTLDGQLRQELPEEDEQEKKEEAPTATPRPAEEPTPRADTAPGAPGEFEHRPVEEPQGVDFTMLLNAMAQPALLFLGEIAPPGTGEPQIDLEQARIQIDMLELLSVKCRGNLTADEEGLLDRILYQLRMLFVSKSSQQPT